MSLTLGANPQNEVVDVEAQANVGDRSGPWMGGLFDFRMGLRRPEQTSTRVDERPP